MMAFSFAAAPQPALSTDLTPDAPSDLYIGSTSSGSFIVLHWTDNAGADTMIERQDPGGDWVEISSTNGNETSDILPSPGTYRYRVRACLI